MSELVAVVVNGQQLFEYDRRKPLSDRQLASLTRMDQEMDAGFTLGEAFFPEPDNLQRAKFVANALLLAVQQDDEARIAASCAYLALRLPELKQVRADLRQNDMVIELIFDRELNNQVKVGFDPRAGKRRIH